MCTSPPNELISWLKHECSLTEKLKKETKEAVLTVLSQKWVKPGWWEKYTLNLCELKLFQREIVMSSHNRPCWYARTFIPKSTYEEHAPFFERLKQESLGALIFNEALVKRETKHCYSISASSLEYYWIPDSIKRSPILWLRFSTFSIERSLFYLVEIFLPDLLRMTE